MCQDKKERCHLTDSAPLQQYDSPSKRKTIRRLSSCCYQASTATKATAWTERSEDSEIELSVTFARTATARYTLSRSDFTPEELRASWYQYEEYNKITKDCCKQIKKMERGEVLKDKKYSTRGLESHTRQGATNKKRNRMNTIYAVLLEQDEQRHRGMVDEEAIAQRCSQITVECQ
jgi:hypothetical protein